MPVKALTSPGQRVKEQRQKISHPISSLLLIRRAARVIRAVDGLSPSTVTKVQLRLIGSMPLPKKKPTLLSMP